MARWQLDSYLFSLRYGNLCMEDFHSRENLDHRMTPLSNMESTQLPGIPTEW